MDDSYRALDIRKHFWYSGSHDLGLPDECVIKSHELPDAGATRLKYEDFLAAPVDSPKQALSYAGK